MPLAPQRLIKQPADLDHPAALTVQPDGTIWVAGEAGQLYRISSNGKRTDLVCTFPSAITCLALSLQNSWLAVGFSTGLARFDLASGQFKLISTFTGTPAGTCFLPSGDLAVSESTNPRRGSLVVIDHNGKITPCKTGPLADPRGMALSADNLTLFVACREFGIMACPMVDGQPGRAEPWVKLREMLPEAIVVDHRANLYVGCHAPTQILKIAPDKWVTVHVEDKRIETLSQPVGMAWSGKKFDQLLVANRGARHITQIDMQQIGLGAVNQR